MILKDLHNKHEDKIACIFGSGPSLRHFDKSELPKDFITICVNSSIAKIPHPDYYVTDDQGIFFWSYYKQYVLPSKAQKLFFKDKLYKYTKDIPGIIYFEHRHYTKDSKNVKMSNNPDVKIIGARSSIGTAINLSYIMGMKKILLLGFDNKIEENKRYYFEFDNQPKIFPIIKEINCQKYMGESKEHFKQFKKYWEIFSKENLDNVDNIEIYNCCIDSDLDIFPKIEFKEAVKKFKD